MIKNCQTCQNHTPSDCSSKELIGLNPTQLKEFWYAEEECKLWEQRNDSYSEPVFKWPFKY